MERLNEINDEMVKGEDMELEEEGVAPLPVEPEINYSRLTQHEMFNLKDLDKSQEDLQELHRTLSELALPKRYQRVLEAAGGMGKSRHKNNNWKRGGNCGKDSIGDDRFDKKGAISHSDAELEGEKFQVPTKICESSYVRGSRKNQTPSTSSDITMSAAQEPKNSNSIHKTVPVESSILSSGDTEKIDRRQKHIRFSNEVNVVYFCEGNTNTRRACEPLADEVDQQARSYRKRFTSLTDKAFPLFYYGLTPKFYKGFSNFGLSYRDEELVGLENMWAEKRRSTIYDILKK